MNSLSFRLIKKNEIKKIFEIESENFEKPWTLKSLEDEYINPSSFIKVCFFNESLSSYIIYRIILDEIHIFKICTIKKLSGKGIGTSLLETVINEHKNIAKSAFLEVDSKNLKALAFYKKNGFEICGKRNNYYGQGSHALNMTKDLSGGL